jgi:chemotaxis protein methyltransferase CheR
VSYRIPWNEYILQRFVQLIASHTGLQIRDNDRKALAQKLDTRMKSLKISQAEVYYQLLEANTENSEREWRQLVLLLTTNETYFFRDQGQFSLLRNHLLPELIDKKRKEKYATGKAKPSLRLWSAGCSTGEEPYSLAILLKQLIPDWKNWDIFILGSDINLEALEKAKQGIYSSWSFRMVDANIQKEYFHPWKNDWKLDETIRRMVTFQHGNLVKDIYPNSSSMVHNMDIIICRNVFVYFDFQTISLILEKLYNTLNSVGYLLTGHAELYGQNIRLFKSKVLPESVVYQRRETASSETSSTGGLHSLSIGEGVRYSPNTNPLPQASELVKKSVPATPDFKSLNLVKTEASPAPLSKAISKDSLSQKKPSETTADTILSEAETLFQKKAYSETLKKAETLLASHPRHFGAYYLIARVYANLGNYHKASQYCQQAISVDSQTVLPYYLLADIAEEQGDIQGAKGFLKKVIYLAPNSIAAYLELGSIYEKEGDVTRCVKMRTVALEMLKKLSPNVTIEKQGGMTAGELVIQLQAMLSNHQ